MCATQISGHLQRFMDGQTIAWVFLTRLDAMWQVVRPHAIRTRQATQACAIGPAADAVVSKQERNRTYEHGSLDAQERTRGSHGQAIQALRIRTQEE